MVLLVVPVGAAEVATVASERERAVDGVEHAVEARQVVVLDLRDGVRGVEAADAQGPYGAKEAGEGPLHPVIPAIANAIYDAVGVRMNATPFSPPRVLAAIEARRRMEQTGALPVHKPGAPSREEVA